MPSFFCRWKKDHYARAAGEEEHVLTEQVPLEGSQMKAGDLDIDPLTSPMPMCPLETDVDRCISQFRDHSSK